MRIGRGYSQQSFTVAGPAFGPRSPILPPPVVTTISVNLASGLATNQRRAQMRFPRQGWEPGITQTTGALPQTWGNSSRRNGPAPPELIGPIPQPPVVTTLSVNFAQAVQRAGRTVRPTIVTLPGPTVVATPEEPSQRVQTIQSSSVVARPPHTRSTLAAPAVVGTTAFVAPPIQVSLQENRDHGLGRRHFPVSFLFQPQTLQVFAAGRPALARVRPRATTQTLSGPTVIRTPSVEQHEQTITVVLVRTRPRPTVRTLRSPVALQVFAGPVEVEIAVRIPIEDHRRQAHYRLAPPQVVRVPSVEQIEQTIRAEFTHARPRPTVHRVYLPTVIRVPSVEQLEQTIRVALVRTKPRHTLPSLRLTLAPTFPPVVTTLLAHTTRAKPRHTISNLGRPVVLQTFAGPQVALTKIHPRRTAHKVSLPTVVRVPQVDQSEDTIRVSLTRTQPRKTRKFLAAPVILNVFSGPKTAPAKIKPRPTTAQITPPTIVRTPSVEQHEQTIRVALVRTRPRSARSVLPETIVAAAAFTAEPIRISLARIEPKKTTYGLRRPGTVHIFTAQMIEVALVTTRPARTSGHLAPPATLQVTARPLQLELAPARRPAVRSRLAPPTVVAPAAPVSLTLTVWLVAVKARLLHRPVKHIQPQIVPVVIPRPGWTDTRTSAAAGVEGHDSPDAATTIGTVKTDAAEISDKRSGT